MTTGNCLHDLPPANCSKCNPGATVLMHLRATQFFLETPTAKLRWNGDVLEQCFMRSAGIQGLPEEVWRPIPRIN